MVLPTNPLSKAWIGKKRMSDGVGNFRKFWLLLWKNWILQKRKKIQTILEVLVPVVFCALLVVIRDLAPYAVFSKPTHYQPFSVSSFPANLTPDGSSSYFEDYVEGAIKGEVSSSRGRRWTQYPVDDSPQHLSYSIDNVNPLSPPPHKRMSPKHRKKRFLGISFTGDSGGLWPLAYSPNNTAIRELMTIVADNLWVDESNYGFATEGELVDRLSTFGKEENKEIVEDILGAVVFTNEFPKENELPEKLSYKIRLKGSQRSKKQRNLLSPPRQWFTEIFYPRFQVPGPRERNDNYGGIPGYHDEGFLAIQHAVDMAVAQYISGVDPRTYYVLELQRMPYPPYIDDTYLVALQAWLPFVLLVSYIYPAINIVKSVVYEKEKKLKESMKMMGLQNWLHWSAWFIKSFMFLATTTSLITILLCVHWQGSGSLAVLSESDPSLVLVFLLLYTICAISFCFFLSTLFSKANSAAAVTGLVWFFIYVPYMILRPRYSSLSQTSKLLLCLLPNTAMSLGCQLISMFEGIGLGIQWKLLLKGVSPDDTFTFGHIFGMLLLDTISFALLTWYIEAVWPGDFGVPQPWYFPFLASYWVGGQAVKQDAATVIPPVQDSDFFEDDPKGLQAGVQVQGLTKVFPRGKKVAVNRLHLNMYDGQITVLLGHNGAGKTTTMSMLTGLFPPSSGTALVGGYDIVKQMNEVRRSLGLCPQHDVLFDELTVAEHIIFFSKLKGMTTKKAEEEIIKMVEKLKLEDKRDAMSKTLSGGMKRKLSVGIALCGGSRVVFLDEPTSGMDPGARRLVWDLLQKERIGRTLLLTTHFMEEADLLGDRIAIMANGVVQCCGSSLFLKRKYGAGYRLIIVKERGCDVEEISNEVSSHIPDAELDQNVGAELSYVLPNADVGRFEPLFNHLEENKETLKISSYGASQTTMDEVFLRVGKVIDSEISEHLDKVIPAGPRNGMIKGLKNGEVRQGNGQVGLENGLLLNMNHDTIEEIEMEATPQDRGTRGGTWYSAATQRVTLVLENAKKLASSTLQTPHPRRTPLKKNTGCILLLQQFRAMLVKKILYTYRNMFLTLAQNIIPVAFLILALIVVQTLPGVNDVPPQHHITMNHFDGTVTALQEVKGNNYSNALKQALMGDFNQRNKLLEVDGETNFTTFILDEANRDLPSFNQHWMVGLQLLGVPTIGQEGADILALFNNQPFHSPPLALSVADQAIVRAVTGNPNITLATSNHPLPRTDLEMLTQDQRQSLGFQIGFNLAFGMSFLAASFVIFVIQERSTKAKHLQFVSGVNLWTYWTASAIWDYLLFLLPCCLCLLCLTAFGMEGLSEWDQLGRIMLILMFYAWASLPLMYLFSFFFSVPSGGFTKMIIINIITGMATVITVTILRIPDLELGHIADLLDWVFLLFPSYAMANAITDVYRNYQVLKICSKDFISVICMFGFLPNPCCRESGKCGAFGCVLWTEDYIGWEKLGVGRMLVFMGVEGVACYVILALVELKVFVQLRYAASWIWRRVSSRNDVEGVSPNGEGDDEDVREEKMRVLNTEQDILQQSDKLIFRNLYKTYDKGLIAVDHLNLGVPLGECFGLLGINGAGKTTTFKMLTGDIQMTSGDAYVNGASVRTQLKKVRQQIGYCPQFDALHDHMTGREVLRMFARLRGVPERMIDSMIRSLAEELLVTQHLDNLFGNYSGGNKRKLSTGVALVGDPPLLLLDEPSSGMDPVARRLLWDVLTAARDAGRSIILTSHSMEECEALCTRLAIMVNGRFCCLGSPQHLKSKFSQGYSIVIRVKMSQDEVDRDRGVDQLDTEMPPEMKQIQDFMNITFPGHHVREKQWGRLEYFVEASGVTWGGVFGTLDRSKHILPIEDYAVTQTTLERVFLTFTRGQRPEEEKR
ncbi:hypothetical protein Pmani_016341 [Petrolisthes manimaculis]|uniref:ABC transporter domain-containing protein n=1 Tax=Petrolisthes manimaculis TaxID=1843537 RepID=A0AAE1PPX0_9EUCA|nr:hypothetical protein Pmani_016341 [Petrolisthes manimaculis]